MSAPSVAMEEHEGPCVYGTTPPTCPLARIAQALEAAAVLQADETSASTAQLKRIADALERIANRK